MYSIPLGLRCFKWKVLSLSGPKTLLFLQLLVSLMIRSALNVYAISKDFLFVSLVTNWISPEEVRLPSFDVLNCWLNLVESFLDDENELTLKVITSFSASHFALSSIPVMVRHSLVTSVFRSKVSSKSLHFLPFVCVDMVLDVIIQSWQFKRCVESFTEVILSCHHIQYLCWYICSSWRLCRPVGMWCDGTLRNIFSSLLEGNACSERPPLVVCICPS